MGKFITVILIQVLSGIEVDLFIPSFPQLQENFNLTTNQVQLTLSLNFIAYCISCLFAGALGDRYNRRRVLLLGLIVFVIGSLLCVLAANFSTLLVGRVLQGAGIAAPCILSLPVVLETCTLEKQASSMGYINAARTLAMALAPLIGSLISFHFDWHANFFNVAWVGMLIVDH